MYRIRSLPIGRNPIFLVIVTCTFCFSGIARADRCENPAATVVSVQGSVEIKQVGDTRWQPARLNDTCCPGDVMRVGDRSRAAVALVTQSVLRLAANTTMTFEGIKDERTSILNMHRGTAHFFSRVLRGLEVKTPFVSAGVRGTEFSVHVEQERTFLTVFDGSVLASNSAGDLPLTSGQSAVTEAGKAPILRVLARPRDTVQWALYYPPVISAVAGRVAPEMPDRDPRSYAHRASLLLSVGQVEEANRDIERALELDPAYSDAFALQAIIAVVQNNRDQALALAEKAVAADPGSANARVALSYARQAAFDLEGARKSLEEAVMRAPGDALAWARYSEIQLSFGYLGKALESAKRAVSLAPNLSRTQTVLGFAYVTQVRIPEATDAFNKAIEFDQADPLPRLGLGLTRIRGGQLREGRGQIEIAASLDPNNSIIRSYLGKAYFEEKRTELDHREYEIAKELDPNDPTPWFYDAIAKQTTNRPVEGLHDLQKAMELNDNRAVYRSRLLLDGDLAARSASLARIYTDLGFQQLALVQGYNSVNTDPGNFSAHRFLADTYSALPRHEIARVSELLQSQLLQPVNITPIQPRLAESNLFLISAGGPENVSFREFNPLFNRNMTAFQANMLGGDKGTLGAEGIISGIYGKASVSAGYSLFETDGFRSNDDQENKVGNVFAQYMVSHKTSIQVEYRTRDNRQGDLPLKFFDEDIRPNERTIENSEHIRLGLRHAFSPGSVLLANLAHDRKDFQLTD